MLTANNYLAPKIIMVDKNATIEAACANVLKNTVLLNCIWHLGHQNLNRNLYDALGKDWEVFISLFWITRNTITKQDFEYRWLKDIIVFGKDKPNIRAYLERIYEYREQ